MSPPTLWGPPIWTLLHTIAANLKEEIFFIVSKQFIVLVKQICSNLPCPDCSAHATAFLSRVNFSHIKTKYDLEQLLYVFHNVVNKRKNKPMFNTQDLEIYKNVNIVTAFKNFLMVYKTKGNMKLLADNFQRQVIVNELRKWLVNTFK